MSSSNLHPAAGGPPGLKRPVINLFANNKIVIAGFLLLIAAWAMMYFSMPPFETPDETGHYAFILSLVNGHYPVMPDLDQSRQMVNSSSGQIQFSPLGFDMALAYHVTEKAGSGPMVHDFKTHSIDDSLADETRISPQAYQPPFYYLIGSLFYLAAARAGLSAVGVFLVTRLSSLLFYLALMAVFWRFFRKIMAPRAADYLTIAVGLQPTLVMMSISVNPEMAALFLLTLTLAILILSIKEGRAGWCFALLMSLLSALAILFKFTNIIVVPTVALTFLFSLKELWPARVRMASLYSAATFLLLVPWFIFNHIYHHAFLPHNGYIFKQVNTMAAGDNYLPARYSFPVLLLRAVKDFVHSTIDIGGQFGFGNGGQLFQASRFLYTAFVFVFLLLGIVLAFQKNKNGKFDQIQIISVIAIGMTVIFLYAYALRQIGSFRYVLQPRYFLSGLLPAAVLIFTGLCRILRKWGLGTETVARGLFALSMLHFLIAVIHSVLPRFYV